MLQAQKVIPVAQKGGGKRIKLGAVLRDQVESLKER